LLQHEKEVDLPVSKILYQNCICSNNSFLADCMQTSSGVIPMNKGIYYISQDNSRLGKRPPRVETISVVYKEANAFCEKEGVSSIAVSRAMRHNSEL